MKRADAHLVKCISICGPVQFIIEGNTPVFGVHHIFNVSSLDFCRHEVGCFSVEFDHQLIRLASTDAKVVPFTLAYKVADDPSTFQLVPLLTPGQQ